jgi:transcriptional/translational regulatory protein YebC/TACO1
MAEAGSVSWQFTRKSYFSFPLNGHDSDALLEMAIEAGADDVTFDDDTVEIFGPVESFKEISEGLKSIGVNPEEAELRMFPNNEVELPPEASIQVVKVIEALEELDDVQNVFSTLSISDEVMAQLEAA